MPYLCDFCSAPDAAWRIMIASGRMAASVFNVSTSDSPLETLEPDAVIEAGDVIVGVGTSDELQRLEDLFARPQESFAS